VAHQHVEPEFVLNNLRQDGHAVNAIKELQGFNLNDPLCVETLLSIERHGENNHLVTNLLEIIRQNLPSSAPAASILTVDSSELMGSVSAPSLKRKSQYMDLTHENEAVPPRKAIKKPTLVGRERPSSSVIKGVSTQRARPSAPLTTRMRHHSPEPTTLFTHKNGRPMLVFVHFELPNRKLVVDSIKVKQLIPHIPI
jgi:hypothetical protein